MIEFKNVTKLYRSVIGVNDISLKLEPGAYGLLGPNGSGKTTFINLITGQLKPTIGEVSVFGVAPTENDSILRKIGLCPALEPFYHRLTGFQWVVYLTRLHGISLDEAKSLAEKALDEVGMSENMNRPISTYSLGMRQRCKLAQAMAHDPELLILDEPFNGLDPVGRIEMTEYLRRWIENGRSLILASHVLHEVEAVHSKFLLISGGRLLASGSPGEVRELMTDCPNVFKIKSDDCQKLSSLLLQAINLDKIELDPKQQTVEIATRDASSLYTVINNIVNNHHIKILQISSTEDSLQELFTSLLKIHRGEM